jgi:hypothetical protein
MNIQLFSIIILLFVSNLSPIFGQQPSERFFINEVFIDTEANPRLIRRYVNKIVSWNKESNHREVECLKEQLNATRLFSKVDSRLARIPDTSNYNLFLTVQYKEIHRNYRIVRIDVRGYSDLDKTKFQELLAERALTGKPLSLLRGFPDFEDQLFEVVTKSRPKYEIDDESSLPWIDVRLVKRGELLITVMPSSHGCS